jgi:excisionase family DNA binding protein
VSGSLLTAGEVADVLGVPKTWVYEQSRLGRIPTVTLGRYRRYRLEAIEAWIRELEGKGGNGNGAVDGNRGAPDRADGE